MRKNLFIAFEGIDGSGKSTHMALLAKKLEETGQLVYCTAEPTRRPAGRFIRDIFAGREQADQHVIAALFAADRLDHLLHPEEGMLRKLHDGCTVLTDRYYLSSYAYHGVHVDTNWVLELNKVSERLRKPDLTIYIDVSPEVSMERIRNSRQETELYETLSNLRAVREKYLEGIRHFEKTEKIITINGAQDRDAVAAAIWSAVRTF